MSCAPPRSGCAQPPREFHLGTPCRSVKNHTHPPRSQHQPASIPGHLLASLGLFLAITATTHARIGETLAELKARYGEGKSISPRMANTEQYEWEKDGYIIQASLRNNITVLKFFHRTDTLMTDGDIKALLKVYRKDVRFSWSTRDNCFKSSDKKLMVGRENAHDDWIYVRDISATEALSGKDKAKNL